MENQKLKKIVYAGLGLIALYGGYYAYNSYNSLPLYNKLEPVPVNVLKAEMRFMQRRETLAGRLEADSSVTLMADMPGRIKNININEGQMVKKGVVLVELENSAESAQVASYVAEVDRMKAQVDRAKALLANQDIPIAALKDKEAELASAVAKKKQAEAALEKTYVKAPFDGLLGLRNVNVGAQVQQNTEIVKITKLDPLRVKFSVSADRLPYITEGNSIDVYIGEEELPVQGAIVAKEPGLHQSTHLVDVLASLSNANQNLIPGQYARVMLVTSKEEEVVSVPETSLIRDDEDNVFVFVVKQGIANKVSVDVGPRYSEGFVEIVTGVNVNDDVVTNLGEAKTLRISDGMPVNIVKDEDA